MHLPRNALAALLLLPCILLAEPPVEWRAELSSGEVATLYASHGDTRAIECRLTLKGAPYTPQLAAFRYGTNGFAGAGWDAPVALSSNLASVAWSPALDPGADMLALLLTLDGTHTAKALLHLRPGPAPGDALPPPTVVLDFAAQPYTNAPWALPSDIPPAPDLSPYATTSQVAEAIAAIPAPEPPDLTPYATWQGLDSATNALETLVHKGLAEYIVLDETARAAVYHGRSADTNLYAGKLCLFRFQSQPSGNLAISLTMAGGAVRQANAYRIGGTQLGTAVAANSIMPLVFDGTYWRGCDYDSNSDTYDRVRLNQHFRAAAAITRNALCVAGDSLGYRRIAPGAAYDPGYPVLYMNRTSTLNAGATDTQFYAAFPGVNVAYTASGWAGRQRAALYMLLTPADSNGVHAVASPALSYDPVRPCVPLGVFHATTTNSFYFLPGPVMEPDPDLSACATTGLVASLHQPSAEWATNAYAWISASPDYDAGGTQTVRNRDALGRRTTAAGIASISLSAWEESRGGESIETRALSGAWSIAAGGDHATLSGSTLLPTNATGPVAVEFARADGGATLRATVSMQMAPAATEAWDICAETTNTWRRAIGDEMLMLFSAVPTNGPVAAYRHGRGNEEDYWCHVLLKQQLYTTNEVKNPTTPNPDGMQLEDVFSACSVGRTDFQTYPDTRPAMMVSPSYAICAAHATPSSATFNNGQTLSFSTVATLGDLRLLRASAPWTGSAEWLPSFLPATVLRRLSPTMLAGTVGIYQSQHGTVHPCLVLPWMEGAGWRAVPPGGDFRTWGRAVRNETYAALAPYGHVPHGGDSGHAVILNIDGLVVPVGLFHFANGSFQSLLDDDVISWLDGHVRADSGAAESLHILAYGDL